MGLRTADETPRGRKDNEGPTPQADCLSTREGRLYIDELDTVELAARFGTPLFVLSETQLRRNVRRFRAAFAAEWEGPVDVMPAFKANTTLASRRVLTDEGAGADVYSPGELEGVLSTPVDRARVSVNGGGKSRDYLAHCVHEGVRITVEDVDEIELIQAVAAEQNRTAKIRLRVKPTVPNLWRPTDFSQLTVPIDLAIQVYKSGIPPEFIVEMGRRAIAAPNIDMVGLHVHQGRHHASLWFWEGLMSRFGKLAGELVAAWDGWQPQEIDIGGGWPSPRDPLNEELPRSEFVLTALGFPLLAGLRGLGARLYHRALAGLVPVLSSHRFPVKRQSQPFPYAWVLTDTTTFFLAGGHFERSRFRHVVANKADRPVAMTADLVGHSCFADQIVLGARLPEVVPGDVIALLETGAYQESSASNFNALPRPATVMVCGDQADVVRRAETVEDVYRRDLTPSRMHRFQGAHSDPVAMEIQS